MKRCLLLFVLIFAHHLLSAQDMRADFTYDKTAGCGPLTVSFQDASTSPLDSIVSWYWQFGDGDSSTLRNPVHTYTTKGAFPVILTVRDARGNVASNANWYPQKYVVVLPLLNIGDEYLVCTMYNPNNKVTLTNKAAWPYADAPIGRYQWSTGDTTASISVGTPGRYTVSYNVCGQTLKDTANVVATKDTTLLYVSLPARWLNGIYKVQLMAYTPYSRSPFSATVVDWADGSQNVQTDPNDVLYKDNFAHDYTQWGNHHVTFTGRLKELNGYCDTVQGIYINVPRPLYIEPFDLGNDTTIALGDTLLLDSRNASARHDWNYGQTTSTIKVAETGRYHVYVINGNNSVSDSIMVTVSNLLPPTHKPQARIEVLQRFCDTLVVVDNTFANGSQINRWHWDFGDGATDTVRNPTHVYRKNGNYTVQLIAGQDGGPFDTAYLNNNIVSFPTLDLGKDTTLSPGDTLLLSAQQTDESMSYEWSNGSRQPAISVTQPGTYWVKVAYCSGIAVDTINITARDTVPGVHVPIAQFTTDKKQCTTVQFTDQSTTPAGTIITKRSWSFGDGTTDTLANPVHTYMQRGSYNVSLLITNSAGQHDTAFSTIYFAPVTVNLGGDTTIATSDSLLLDARKPEKLGDASYSWSTGDTTPVIIVRHPGIYAVTVRSCGLTASDTIVVNADTIPAEHVFAGFRSERVGCLTIRFRDTSAVTNGYITQWRWSFGDGTTDTLQNPVHTYAGPGQRMVTLVVTNNYGERDTAYGQVNLPFAPSVNLGPDIDSLNANGLTLGTNNWLFSDRDYQFLWSTGDSTRTILVTTPGTYWLRVTDRFCGSRGSDTIRVSRVDSTASHTLHADFITSRLSCRSFRFTNTSTVTGAYINRYFWQFGDNTTDSTANPSHTYREPGTYTVVLLVTDNLGKLDTAFKQAIINRAPVVNLGADLDTLAAGGYTLGYNNPDGAYNYQWSTGDTTRTLHVTQPGTYWVKVTDIYCNISASDTIVIHGLPLTDIGNPDTVNAGDSVHINAQFNHPFNNNNVFTVQLLKGNANGKLNGETAGDIVNIATVPGATQHLALNVVIPETVPCGENYQIRVVSSSPMDSTAWSAAFEVKNQPESTIRQQGDSLFAGKALTYQWYMDGAPIANAVQPAIRAKANGQYYVMVSNGESCRGTSSTVNMKITAATDVTLVADIVKAFPNPTSGVVYLRFEKQLLKPVIIQVQDTYGNVVYSRRTQDQTGEMDLSGLPKGVYYLSISNYGKQKALRIVLQ